MTKRQSDLIENLKTFREISLDQNAYPDILKEKKIILYAATLLENDNVRILELCLDILENFVGNESSHAFLLSTFGIYEALETLSIRMRSKNESIHQRATEITEILRNSAPPAYNTRSRLKGNKPLKRNNLFLLFIEDLNYENQVKVERALIKIKGIISFLMDMELKRCTIRICPRVTIKEVIEKLYHKCSLKAVVVTKNIREGTEVSI
ncbi:hypothetical protein NQ314_003246 [Rhamnusium bicolor]|uniref:ATP synthase protein MI25 n=1 Tax=Rhamnusium bicolor TaxID=1586634 RepID=A0AAV8ZMW7_9CUCU|nr:hypothetical protein NQ314_003246 [Rhamnusium bicolor]